MISRPQRLFVELNACIQHAGFVARVHLQSGIMRRREHVRAMALKIIDDRDSKRRSLLRIGSGADFIQQNQRRHFTRLDHRSDVCDV